jgi:hypothetical protein
LPENCASMSEVVLDDGWSPTVRRLAQLYRDAVRQAGKDARRRIGDGGDEEEALAVQCAEEALAVVSLLQGLGKGGTDPDQVRSSGRYVLELQVHVRDAEVSRNFFRLAKAADGKEPLDALFSREGRTASTEAAEARRVERVEDLREAIEAWKDLEERIEEDRLPWDRERRKREEGSLPMPPPLRHRSGLSHMASHLKHHLKVVGSDGKD